jgi:hypothetical protein
MIAYLLPRETRQHFRETGHIPTKVVCECGARYVGGTSAGYRYHRYGNEVHFALIHIQMTQMIQKLIELILKGLNLISIGNCHSKILYFIVFVI